MNKIEELKVLKAEWAKELIRAVKNHRTDLVAEAESVIYGITMVLETLENSNCQKCNCPQGSICEFFNQDENCLYGKI